MKASRFIDIDGKRMLWRDLVQRRREQLAALKRQEQQPMLFELKEDVRPATERKADDRYRQPSLFTYPLT